MKKKVSAFWVIGLILLGFSTLMTLAGGIGTTCIAFNAAEYGDKWAPFIPVQPIMQGLVVVSILAGIGMVYALIQFIRREPKSYLWAVITLLVGAIASGVQYYLSFTLREGSTAPNSMRLYITVFTLLFFALLKIPGIWNKLGLDRQDHGSASGVTGAMMIVLGMLTVTMRFWAGPSHMIGAWNTVDVLAIPLLVIGSGLIASGVYLVVKPFARLAIAEKAASQD